MKAIGDPITLTRNFWYGPEPVTGDILRTRTGRQYVILKIRGKKLECIVAPKDETTEGTVFDWEWGRRKKSH